MEGGNLDPAVLRGRGNLGRIYQPIVRYGISGMSQRNSVGGSSNAAFCCQYHRHRIDNIQIPYLPLSFSALTLSVGWQEGHPACKKFEWWGAGMAICLELGAELHIAQLMPLPLTVSCFSKNQIGFAFSGTGSPG